MTIDHASSLDGSPPQVEGPALGRRATDRRIIHRPAVKSNPENSRLIEDATKLKSWRLWGHI